MLRGSQQMDCVSFFIWVRRVKIRITFTCRQIALEKSSNIIEAFEQREFRFRPREIWVSELNFYFFLISKNSLHSLQAEFKETRLSEERRAPTCFYTQAASISSSGATGTSPAVFGAEAYVGGDVPGCSEGHGLTCGSRYSSKSRKVLVLPRLRMRQSSSPAASQVPPLSRENIAIPTVVTIRSGGGRWCAPKAPLSHGQAPRPPGGFGRALEVTLVHPDSGHTRGGGHSP